MHFLVFYKHLRLEDLKFAREIPVSIFKNLFCTRFEPELSRFFELTRMFSSSAGASVFLVVKGTCVNNLKVWMKLLIQRPRAWIGGDLAITLLGGVRPWETAATYHQVTRLFVCSYTKTKKCTTIQLK